VTDEELVRRYRRTGEPELFEALIGRHISTVRRLLMVIAGPEDREDLEQEILAELYLALPKFRGDSRFSTYLYRFTRNKTIDYIRKRARRRKRGPLGVVVPEPDIKGIAGSPTIAAAVAAREADPVHSVIDAETAATVRAVLAALPEEERTMIYLKDGEDRSIREVAEIIGIPEGTVKSRLSRSRRKLARMLAEAGVEEAAL
jgi:RNA polymerase sigma-70 factor (ECF subfamily)